MQSVRSGTVPRLPGACAVAALAMLAVACQSTVTPTVNVPASLVEPLPVTAAVYYEDALRNHRVANDTPGYSRLVSDSDILSGRASVQLFDRLFSSVFAKTVSLDDKSAARAHQEHADAIVEARIVYLRTHWYEQGLSLIESASVRYAVALSSTEGAQLRSWTVDGEGRSAQMTGFSSLEDAIALAMRDAGARLIVAIYKDPGIKRCLVSDLGAPRAGARFLQCITAQ